MENTEIKIIKFGTWDWVVTICWILIGLYGLILLLSKNVDGVGFLFWGVIATYIKLKKYKKSLSK